MGSTRCTSASHSGRRLIGNCTGEKISTTKISAFTIALVTTGLAMSWAMANPIEVAISDDNSSAGTTIGDTVRVRPYRQAARARVTMMPGTASSVVETLRTWLAALGKTPVVLRHGVPGFVANRLQYALLREAHALVAAGVCSWADADLAVARGLGPRWAAVGPFQSMDMAGLDVHLAVAGALFPGLAADTAPPQALARLVEAGHLGTKSGRGLLGGYPAERQEALTRQRDVTLRLMPAVRAAAASQAGPGPTEPPAEGPRQ